MRRRTTPVHLEGGRSDEPRAIRARSANTRSVRSKESQPEYKPSFGPLATTNQTRKSETESSSAPHAVSRLECRRRPRPRTRDDEEGVIRLRLRR